MAATPTSRGFRVRLPRAAARAREAYPPLDVSRLACRVLLLLLTAAVGPAAAGTLQSVTPLGASAGITVRVTGTGLDPVAANNEVMLRLAGGGETRVEPNSVSTLDAAGDVRRLSFVVPAGLATGTATLSVFNRTTGATSTTRALEVIGITLSSATLTRGKSTSLRITGSPNAQLVAGRTLVTLGPGVTVTSTTVESLTSPTGRRARRAAPAWRASSR
jgi:hypothetical protein